MPRSLHGFGNRGDLISDNPISPSFAEYPCLEGAIIARPFSSSDMSAHLTAGTSNLASSQLLSILVDLSITPKGIS